MKLVIDIDENVFTRLFDNGIEDYEIAKDDLSAIAGSIRGGTPVSEGCCKLKDADALKQEILRRQYSNSFCKEHHIDHSLNTEIALAIVDDVLTFLNADKKG